MKKSLINNLLFVEGSTLSKTSIVNAARTAATEAVESGQIDALRMRISIKRMMLYLKSFDECLEEAAMQEAEQFGMKEFHEFGASLQVKELGVRYDYSNTPYWNALNEAAKQAAQPLRELEKKLQKLEISEELTDEQTGEVFQAMPPVKKSKTGISITLK